MKSDYMNNQFLLETEQEQDFQEKMQAQLLLWDEIPEIGSFNAYERLKKHEWIATVMPYISSDFEVFKLYVATHISSCTASASRSGLPGNIVDTIKKDAFVRITKATKKQDLEKIMLDILRALQAEYRSHSVHLYSHTIQRAVEFIHLHKHQPLRAADVTDHLKMERTNLSHRFHQETGMTITDYIHSVKMDAAESLILARTYSLTEIADLLGYSSYHYFSRVYKKYKGCLPKEAARMAAS